MATTLTLAVLSSDAPIEVAHVGEYDLPDRLPTFVCIVHDNSDCLPESVSRGVLPGPLSEGLAHLRAVNTVEPDTLGLAQVHNLDGVAIDDSNDLAGEVFRRRREADHENQ